jgi:hypothetical protein
MSKPILLRRQRAAAACLKRFDGRPFDWKRNDCVRVVRHDLHHLGVGVPFLKGLRYGTPLGARRALKAAGFADLLEGMDATGLPRIGAASALIGDVIAIPTDEPEPWGAALTVAVGNGRVFGFLNGTGQVFRPKAFTAAWRVL